MKLIPTRVHGILDYLTAGAYCVVPRLGGATTVGQRVMYGFAAATALYSALTRYELGIVKKIPMPVHLGLDVASGLLIGGAALMHKKTASQAMLVGMGLFEIAVALCTETRTSHEKLPKHQSTAPIAQVGRLYTQLADAVSR